MMMTWNGAGRTSQDPYVEIITQEWECVDYFGRTFTIPVGSTVKQFETTNKGWVVWATPERELHVRDLG